MTFISESRTDASRDAKSAGGRLAGWFEPVLLALLATLFVTLVGLRGSDATGIANSDDLMRLVEVRDLLAGQDWFDLHQYRLGLEGGTLMHWSRLVDAPIAAIVMAVTALTGDAALGEAAAKIIWPALTLLFAMAALMTACARTGNAASRLPVAVVGAIALWTTGAFGPGALDHHNIQIALSLWLLALLVPGSRPVVAHAWAGLVAVLMIAIGMEVMPYVALAGAYVTLRFALGVGRPAELRAFGGAIAGSALAVFLATVAPANWGYDACDAFSSFHLVVGATAGLGLVAASFTHGMAARVTALAALGVAGIGIVVLAFPHCLANPLAGLDPRLRTFWLEGVIETRSLADLWAEDPFQIVGLYGMALCAFAVSALSVWRAAPLPRGQAVAFASFLAMGIAVTAWQQRGFIFAAGFAILPLGFWIARMRAAMPAKRGLSDSLRLAGAWAVSLNLFWWMAGAQAASLFAAAPTLQQQAAGVSARDYCYTADLYAPLAAESPGVVLGATDIGAMILLNTHHRAVAGPYHRDTAGNLLLIDAMLSDPDATRTKLAAHGVTLIADCLNGADGFDFIEAAPNGLQAALRSDRLPGWLEPVASTVGKPLVLYRVRP